MQVSDMGGLCPRGVILVSPHCLLDGVLTELASCRERMVCSHQTLRHAGSLTLNADFWSVKFYPYTQPGVDPVFAVAGGKRVSHFYRVFTARHPMLI